MATLTIFANFYINDEERFLRMKDSFMSFRGINAEKWVINVRGKFKFETLFFLHDHLGDKLIPFTMESDKGWFYDTAKMLPFLDSDYVFFWVEDHISLVHTKEYTRIIEEMSETDSDYMLYSWWRNGFYFDVYKNIEKEEKNNIFSFELTKKENVEIQKRTPTYLIGMQGIFENKFFNKIIIKGPPILRGYTKFCPFDFEKGGGDTEWLPIRMSIPKFELFASIDDGGEDYCLQSRGLYPVREKRPETPIKTISRISKIWRYINRYLPEKMVKFVRWVINFISKLKHLVVFIYRRQ